MTEIKFSKWPRLSTVRQRKINYNKEQEVKPLKCELTKNILSSRNNEPYFQDWIMKNKRSRGKRREKKKKKRVSSVRTKQNFSSWKKPDFKGLMMEKNYLEKSIACWVQIDKKNKFLKGARFSKLARGQKNEKDRTENNYTTCIAVG